jgi:myo-inositol-1(or 4)-monophosphatase
VDPARSPVERAGLAELAAHAARQAGALLLEASDGRRTSVETKSSPTDMVTEMDRAAEALIREILRRARPDDAILGEEGGEDPSPAPARVRWIVDPLDGTTNYLYGFPVWSVSVAAEVEGSIDAGAVYDPLRSELFMARRSGGAECNGRALRIASSATLATALVGTGFAYDRVARTRQAHVAARVLAAVRDIRRAGSAALDLCWVAAGRLDAYFEQGTKLWDYAAGTLIATEAGAWVGGFDGGPPSEAGIIAAAPHLVPDLRSLLADDPG